MPWLCNSVFSPSKSWPTWQKQSARICNHQAHLELVLWCSFQEAVETFWVTSSIDNGQTTNDRGAAESEWRCTSLQRAGPSLWSPNRWLSARRQVWDSIARPPLCTEREREAACNVNELAPPCLPGCINSPRAPPSSKRAYNFLLPFFGIRHRTKKYECSGARRIKAEGLAETDCS